MSEERPMEPCCTTENPEQWAAIAEWEADRADRLWKVLKRVASHHAGGCDGAMLAVAEARAALQENSDEN